MGTVASGNVAAKVLLLAHDPDIADRWAAARVCRRLVLRR